jgi:hypothetical protein
MKNNVEGVLTIIGLIILVVMLLGLPLQLLWNWLMPNIFGLKYITFWEAVGINTISSILFKSNINIKKDN